MSISSKSPVKVVRTALKVGSKALPEYSHQYSPKKFKQVQLFACLVLRKFFKADYRGIEAILRDSPNLRAELGIKEAPHFTTLQKAERRILKSRNVARLLEESIFFESREKA